MILLFTENVGLVTSPFLLFLLLLLLLLFGWRVEGGGWGEMGSWARVVVLLAVEHKRPVRRMGSPRDESHQL